MARANLLNDAAAPMAHSPASGSAPAGDIAGESVTVATQVSQLANFKPRARKYHNIVPVVLVDRSPLLRAGLRRVLSGSRFRVTADYTSLEDVPPEGFGLTASIVMLGLDRDVDAVLRTVRALKERHRELRVVMLRERLDPEQLVAAIEAGVAGYLLRDEVSPNTILKSLEMILADGVVVHQGFTKFLGITAQRVTTVSIDAPLADQSNILESVRTSAVVSDSTTPANSDLARLSDRERLILNHLTLGASNKQIARSLDVAEATVKAHVKSLLRKLRITNRTQAAMWAINQARLVE
ncbi:LuxR C-terminal-related transcriptional regulator [Rhodopila sp.]|uniref:LuxR C-terminal-related transcriptional regulator n=1 Tax=Rhodopila sp. TaxID=2480087 RepID=UPI003D0C2580